MYWYVSWYVKNSLIYQQKTAIYIPKNEKKFLSLYKSIYFFSIFFKNKLLGKKLVVGM
jgi:hypothetical protein